MPTFTVTATLLSREPGSVSVPMVHCRDDSVTGAMVAVAQLLESAINDKGRWMPDILSITVDVHND